MRQIGCYAALFAALLLAGCSSSYEYDRLLAQARAEHQDWRDSAPPVRHASRARHKPRLRTARHDSGREEEESAVPALATGAVAPRAPAAATTRPTSSSAAENAYLRERMRRPSPVVDSPEWKIEKAAEARREREIERTIHSICSGC